MIPRHSFGEVVDEVKPGDDAFGEPVLADRFSQIQLRFEIFHDNIILFLISEDAQASLHEGTFLYIAINVDECSGRVRDLHLEANHLAESFEGPCSRCVLFIAPSQRETLPQFEVMSNCTDLTRCECLGLHRKVLFQLISYLADDLILCAIRLDILILKCFDLMEASILSGEGLGLPRLSVLIRSQ